MALCLLYLLIYWEEKMKIKNLDWYMSSADRVSFGIDYVKLNLKQIVPFLSDFFDQIQDYGDSRFPFKKQISNYSLSMSKMSIRNGLALTISIVVNNVSHKILQYLEYSISSSKILKSAWSLVYYSTYFRLLEIWVLDYTFEKVFFGNELDTLLNSAISRIDYRLDFFYKEPSEIMKMEDIVEYRSDYSGSAYSLDERDYQTHQNILFKNLKKNKIINYDIKTVYRKWDFQSGWSVWNKKNQSLFIRCYEKTIHVMKNFKFMIYTDYFDCKNVYRLEIEFLTKFNKKENNMPFKYSEISELEYKIHRFFGLADRLEGEKFIYQYKENKKINFSWRLRKFKDFGGRWYSISKLWCNSFNILYDILDNKMDHIKLNIMIYDFKKYVIMQNRKYKNKTLSSKINQEWKKKMKNPK